MGDQSHDVRPDRDETSLLGSLGGEPTATQIIAVLAREDHRRYLAAESRQIAVSPPSVLAVRALPCRGKQRSEV